MPPSSALAEPPLRQPPAMPAGGAGPAVRGGTWVTRTGIKVDRIGSAWLIRRFIDPAARFKFVPAKGYRPEPGSSASTCTRASSPTRETAAPSRRCSAGSGLTDPALRTLGEIVHDVDCKDEKFGRAEAAGIASLIGGLVLAYPDDAERLERGAAVFEGLYAYISSGARSRPAD